MNIKFDNNGEVSIPGITLEEALQLLSEVHAELSGELTNPLDGSELMQYLEGASFEYDRLKKG